MYRPGQLFENPVKNTDAIAISSGSNYITNCNIYLLYLLLFQNPDVGKKEIWYSSEVLLERMDVETLTENSTITLINWGNVIITKITR